MGNLNNGFFFKFLFNKKRRKRRIGFRYSHCVEKKKSHELVLCNSLMVGSFHGSKSSFFRLSLFLTVFFFLGSKLKLVWHSHVRYWWNNKGLGMGPGFALKFENREDWAWMCIYMNESTFHNTAFSLHNSPRNSNLWNSSTI